MESVDDDDGATGDGFTPLKVVCPGENMGPGRGFGCRATVLSCEGIHFFTGTVGVGDVDKSVNGVPMKDILGTNGGWYFFVISLTISASSL
jgi:hypothetical protein